MENHAKMSIEEKKVEAIDWYFFVLVNPRKVRMLLPIMDDNKFVMFWDFFKISIFFPRKYCQTKEKCEFHEMDDGAMMILIFSEPLINV